MNERATGILKLSKQGDGVLLDPAQSLHPDSGDVAVPRNLIRDYQLVEGASVVGDVTRKRNEKTLISLESVCGLEPEAFRSRTPFRELVAIDPTERFHLAVTGNTSMRIVDLIAPIGKGTRGLIAAPPKSGKTQLLEAIATAIRTDAPETRIIVLLLDERPEEVTHFRRSVEAEVFSSSSDQSIQDHVSLAEMTTAHVRCELECGRDVVLMVDSLTRMARAVNLHGSGTRRTLSGGVDAGALEMPRRLFGLARNVEYGGSVTVIGTALIDTGSRMDDVLYEEFKSTGNSELVLDRELAEARIFPAIDLLASGTRKEECLYGPDEVARLGTLRRWLAGGTPKAAMNGFLQLLEQVETNEELLERLNP